METLNPLSKRERVTQVLIGVITLRVLGHLRPPVERG